MLLLSSAKLVLNFAHVKLYVYICICMHAFMHECEGECMMQERLQHSTPSFGTSMMNKSTFPVNEKESYARHEKKKK